MGGVEFQSFLNLVSILIYRRSGKIELPKFPLTN